MATYHKGNRFSSYFQESYQNPEQNKKEQSVVTTFLRGGES